MNLDANVVVVGGGPAGLAVAIAASGRGLDSIVVDAQMPPIDKPCGEGLLPHGVTALRALGIQLDSDAAYPFAGIRFSDHDSSVSAKFSEGGGFALRRVRLHGLLLNRAALAGVSFLWGTRITDIESKHVTAGGNRLRFQWLVGADGQNSGVRKRANLVSHSLTQKRFGFRRHYRIRPWTDVVEVYWAKGCQAVVTPVGDEEVGVAVFSRDPRVRLEQALPMFPSLASKFLGAVPTSKESGSMTVLMGLPAVTRGRVALVGDASGTVDALTGHGLSLSFQQAHYLAEAFKDGNLSDYESAHRKLNAMPATMTRLMMLMERSDWVRRRTLRLFQKKPDLFSKLLSINTGDLPLSSVGAAEIADFGWNFLWA